MHFQSPADMLVTVLLAHVKPWIAIAVHVLVALMWQVLDRRIERVLAGDEGGA